MSSTQEVILFDCLRHELGDYTSVEGCGVQSMPRHFINFWSIRPTYAQYRIVYLA